MIGQVERTTVDSRLNSVNCPCPCFIARTRFRRIAPRHVVLFGEGTCAVDKTQPEGKTFLAAKGGNGREEKVIKIRQNTLMALQDITAKQTR